MLTKSSGVQLDEMLDAASCTCLMQLLGPFKTQLEDIVSLSFLLQLFTKLFTPLFHKGLTRSVETFCFSDLPPFRSASRGLTFSIVKG